MKENPNRLGRNSLLSLLTFLQVSSKRWSAGFFMGLLFLCFVASALSVSRASEATPDSWSFRFNDLPVAEALKQLSQVTGISVFSNRPPENKRLTRSYENENIEQIIRDILRGVNYTLEWRTNNKGLASVAITFMDEDTGGFRQSSGGSTRYGGGWSADRHSDDEIPQPQPQIRYQNKPAPRRPLAGNPRTTPTAEASEEDDEEIEAEDVSESEEGDEELSSVSERVEDGGFGGGVEPSHESLDEVAEDEESTPPDREEASEDSGQ
jgi:hypothetical protein